MRFSGGGGVVAEVFRDLKKPMRFSGGRGGVAEEVFRGLKKPMRFSSSVRFNFSVTFFYFPEGGGPGPLGPPPESATAS